MAIRVCTLFVLKYISSNTTYLRDNEGDTSEKSLRENELGLSFIVRLIINGDDDSMADEIRFERGGGLGGAGDGTVGGDRRCTSSTMIAFCCNFKNDTRGLFRQVL